MRGSPMLRALLAFLAILALGWPLRELTGASRAAPPASANEAPGDKAQTVRLQLTFTTVPTSVEVRHLGKEVWRVTAPAADLEKALEIPFPAEGVDLQFEVEFSGDAPLAAMRAQLTDPAGETHEKALWGTGRIDDVLTFP